VTATASEPRLSDELREQSLGSLLKGIGEDSSLMMRQEIELAKAELGEKAAQVGKGLGLGIAAAIILLAALGAGTAAAIAGCDVVMPLWTAALVVMGAEIVLAAVLGLVAKSRLTKATPVAPARAVANLKETKRDLIS
jgi:hypothetical protein